MSWGGRSLCHQEDRQDTFTGRWERLPSESVTPEDLAAAGFYFNPSSGCPDRCTCFMCGVSLVQWHVDDNPVAEHLRHAPSCSYARTAAKLQEQQQQQQQQQQYSHMGGSAPASSSARFSSRRQLVPAGGYSSSRSHACLTPKQPRASARESGQPAAALPSKATVPKQCSEEPAQAPCPSSASMAASTLLFSGLPSSTGWHCSDLEV